MKKYLEIKEDIPFYSFTFADCKHYACGRYDVNSQDFADIENTDGFSLIVNVDGFCKTYPNQAKIIEVLSGEEKVSKRDMKERIDTFIQ